MSLKLSSTELHAIIQRFGDASILVIGDLILDCYIWGRVDRISPEAPVPVVTVTRESIRPGGACNVANNIQALGGRAMPLGLVGNDEAQGLLRGNLERYGIENTGLVPLDGFHTIRKTRIFAHQQQVVRVDREQPYHEDDTSFAALKPRLAPLVDQHTTIILSDYGKGTVSPQLIDYLRSLKPKLLCVDPKDRNFDHYGSVDVITPNKGEAERMSGIRIDSQASLERAGRVILERHGCRLVLVTLGEQGMAIFERNNPETITIPTRARQVYDVSGAGDTVIATFVLALDRGATPHQAAHLANAAAGIVVGKTGTASVSPEELMQALQGIRN